MATAVCWAGSSTAFAYASRAAGSVAVNLFRLLVAVPVLAVLAALASGQLWPWQIDGEPLLLLAASGLVGLVLGDLGLFHALAVLGPRVASVVMATWPAFTVLIETARGHVPHPNVVGGVLITVVGVVIVLLRSRSATAWNPKTTPRLWLSGLAGALLGALGQAGGVVLARAAMEPGPGSDGLDPLPSTVVRMAAGAVGLQCLGFLHRRPMAWTAVLRERRTLAAASLGAVFGPIVGVWLSMVATRHARDLGVASSLMATTPIFVMPIAAFLYGARIGWLGIVGTLLAVGGAVVSFVYGAA